ncbi:MAG: SufS family cysteine desulfurase [Bifidobacteriaceae bacterium]|jgi:cysteine desulfurase/selenocysteine lyase|nr:SufS family cysteine desulfurase [Bifidobacteriaceae bacterium]
MTGLSPETVTSPTNAHGLCGPGGLPDLGAPREPITPQEVERIRRDFPILARKVRSGHELIYLDTAATAQRPSCVMDAMTWFANNNYAAVNRGAHLLGEESTEAFEDARARVARFFGATPSEIVFTSGTTAALNLIALSLGELAQGEPPASSAVPHICPGDRIVVTQAEHHANLVPWQRLAARTGAELAWIDAGPDGRLNLESLAALIDSRTRVLAFTHASNVTGAVTDVARLVEAARSVGALTVLDAAQSAPHLPVDFRALGVDLAAISAHKMLGPNGIGALYGRREVLEQLPPVFTGGSMVEIVTMTEATFCPPPGRFEAGTQPVTEAIGWAAALDYLSHLGMDRLAEREAKLTARLLDAVTGIPGVRLLGPADPADRLGVVALDIEGVHPHDAGQYLDDRGIAVRVGHHCAQPIHRALGVRASTRASVGLYNTEAEIDAFAEALANVRPYFGATQ